ncbi:MULTISPECIES: L,D-transpeptidase family protein [unclassified Microbacterium]|uniref:L,D-transpeptidase family protein n=1 Tax=unclassified Microbacterium TaxID=2609290 RepID=UPI002469432A|nr:MULTISPECIES: L,D-transpeptidase family protein [unclassified Microbacterium]MDH5134885.1 L,D-transpeptidase family protein [Microbacterium sp. RD10]MDH5137827.1 L,D-transpeptidase family protein [Microbacterium sp. RD11]MDH5146769.1 L,D-transpeptidase family protein [Microbacterium sp. RD12]MDH5155804.1 L,D-transpeptidase family protein [Microbacterium sp. RD06]MDH5168028.1 L,D-transpeptidase family protein [Microbacterium sp. RD02]
MTDLISTPGTATGAQPDDATPTSVLTPEAATDTVPPQTGEQPLAWAPVEPAPKKRRLGLWIGLGLGVVALGAGAASMILIAPGTTVAGIPVGWMTPGAAAETISSHLAQTEVTLTGDGDDAVLTGADLGATADATALADAAFSAHPMWNLGAWMGDPVPADIVLDQETASAALRAAVPGSFVDPVDAAVVFDAAKGTYTVTPSVPGTGVDVADLNAAFVEAVGDGRTTFEYPGGPVEALPAVSDDDATATATTLNTMLSTIGFYVGKERTVPVSPAVAASWLTVVDEDGQLRIEADPAAIQTTVDTLPAAVDRAPVNATNIVDSAGNVLRAEKEGATGRALGDTDGIADDFATQLAAGDGTFALSVTETPFETTNLFRRAEINLSTQRAYLFENDKVVQSWAVSTGLPGTPTPTGNFKVFAHTSMQDMGCYEGAPYCTEDVPWITWFAPNIGFHGTYWHNNFGNRMSHGCVNLPIDLAKYVYDWSPVGLEVSVYN